MLLPVRLTSAGAHPHRRPAGSRGGLHSGRGPGRPAGGADDVRLIGCRIAVRLLVLLPALHRHTRGSIPWHDDPGSTD